MFKNYLLLSFKVLKRKPFYTFVSLFGISFTLTILMVISSMADASVGKNAPMTDRDNYVFVNYMERSLESVDTVYNIDSVLMESGEMRYDTTTDFNENNSTSTNNMNYKFMDQNLRTIASAENYSFLSNNYQTDVYLDGRKINLRTFFVDANYWDVFDFNFVAGSPFTPEDNTQANQVAVMTTRGAKEYFGTADASVVGREIVLNERVFKVKGLVNGDQLPKGTNEVALEAFHPSVPANYEVVSITYEKLSGTAGDETVESPELSLTNYTGAVWIKKVVAQSGSQLFESDQNFLITIEP
jgi:putative ABC transport system permease protein